MLRRRHVVVPCLLLASAIAYAQGVPPEQPRTITVTGTGTAVGEPDEARVQLTVQKSAPEMAAARADALAVVDRFIALTKKLGIDPKKVRTTAAFVNPEYRWDEKNNRQVLIGYLVQRQFEVELDDLDKLGALIEGAVDAGVNNVAPPVLDSSRRSELQRRALAAAAKDAQANARAVADTLGVTLGALRELTAGDARPPQPPVPVRSMRMEAAVADAAATYMAGSLEIEARVNATFDVVDRP
jgi:hypothetical protein